MSSPPICNGMQPTPPCICTVSYTHLDVYKRQIYDTTDPDVRAEKLREVDKSLNQTCIVVKIDYPNTGVLLASDVPLSFWERFISTETLKAVILKAPHHGDIDCINREFIETVGAKYLVISVDNEGIYDLPSPEIEMCIRDRFRSAAPPTPPQRRPQGPAVRPAGC